MIHRQEGEIQWTVSEIDLDGQQVTELRFEKQATGEYAGQYHPLFYMMPMVFLSQFIEPTYKLWRAYLGSELIGSNLVREDGRVLSYEDGRQTVEHFANSM